MRPSAAPFLGLLLLLVSADSARDVFMLNVDDAEGGRHSTGTHPFMGKALMLHLQELFKNELIPSSEGLPTGFCNSCLEITRKAKEILRDPASLKEIASSFCRTAPANLGAQCTKMVELYKREAVLFLQQAISEEKFCNNAGFCTEDIAQESSPTSSVDAGFLLSKEQYLNEMLSKLQKGMPEEVIGLLINNGNYPPTDNKILLELNWNRTCNACHTVLDKVRNELEDPDKEMKLIASLLKACETEVFVYRCKKLVFAYGPMVISTLQKIASVDLCRMMHICVDPKNQTDPTNYVQPGRYLPSVISKFDLV